MKVSIDVGKGWCASMVKCRFCGSEFTNVRERTKKIQECKCPVCNQIVVLEEQETPWVGLIERIVK